MIPLTTLISLLDSLKFLTIGPQKEPGPKYGASAANTSDALLRSDCACECELDIVESETGGTDPNQTAK